MIEDDYFFLIEVQIRLDTPFSPEYYRWILLLWESSFISFDSVRISFLKFSMRLLIATLPEIKSILDVYTLSTDSIMKWFWIEWVLRFMHFDFSMGFQVFSFLNRASKCEVGLLPKIANNWIYSNLLMTFSVYWLLV